MTPTGINQREADVAAAFRMAVDKTIELRPDLIVIAGDVFQNVRPHNHAILHAYSNFSRLVRALPDAIIIMISGNHDAPRATETGCILRLFSQLGIHVVDGVERRIAFPERDLSVLAVPAVSYQVDLRPDKDFRHNVLVFHRLLNTLIPGQTAGEERTGVGFDVADLHAPSWSYVALGHYHVFREVMPNAFYSGATEYTSSNPWGELREEASLKIRGKGIIEYDLDSASLTFHPLPPGRVLVDLPAISARGHTAIELDEMIRAAVDACKGGIDDKVVRLVIRDCPRHIAREIDHAAIRSYKGRALHFLLDTRRPEIGRVQRPGVGAPGTRRSLEDTVRDKLNARELDADIDRQALVDLALRYLRDAEVADAPVVLVES